MTTDEKLLWGIVHNAHRRSRDRSFRWKHVRDAVGCGATAAQDLCRRFDANPDDILGETCVPESELEFEED